MTLPSSLAFARDTGATGEEIAAPAISAELAPEAEDCGMAASDQRFFMAAAAAASSRCLDFHFAVASANID
jgi:hypothetical protein